MTVTTEISTTLWWKDYGLLPDGWETVEIKDAFQFLRTNSLSRNQLTDEIAENSIYNVHYGDIHAAYTEPILDLSVNEEVPVLKPDASAAASDELADGDLVIADASEDYEGVGQAIELTGVGSKKVIAGLHTFALRDKSQLTETGFRSYIFRHPKVANAIKVIATGSKVYGVSKTNLAKLSIVLPRLPEQKKIATILGTWDKAIDKQEKLIAEKEDLKKGLMQQLLTGRKRFPGFTDEWRKVEIQEIGRVIRGSSPRPKGDPRYYGGNVPRLMVQDVTRDGKYVTPSIDFLTEEGAKKSRPCPAGTLTIVCSGDVGTPSFLAVDACIHDGFLAIVDLTDKVNEDYLFYQLIRMKERMERSATHGGVFTNLKTTILKEFIIELPAIDEQAKIAKVLSTADDELKQLNNQLTMLKDQKKGLMQQLLTGKVRVKIDEE